MKVVGCGRRHDNIDELAAQLNHLKGKLYARQCDLEQESDIRDLFQWIENNKELGQVDVCINNAGMSTKENLIEGNYDNWKRMMSINVIALQLCTQLSVEMMKRKGIDDGHIIMISSMSGHRVPPNPSTRFYCATKYAVNALVEGWRQEVRDLGTHIRVSALSPGLVETEFQSAMYPDDPEQVKSIQSSVKCLQAEDMAESVKYMLSAPPHVQIHDILVRPTEQKF